MSKYYKYADIDSKIFDINNVKEAMEYLKSNIEAPYVNAQYSTLGGEENISIMLTVSLDKKEEWANNILQNSNYGKFHIKNSGVVEMFSGSWRRVAKFRKCTVKNYGDIVKKINTWIEASAEV